MVHLQAILIWLISTGVFQATVIADTTLQQSDSVEFPLPQGTSCQECTNVADSSKAVFTMTAASGLDTDAIGKTASTFTTGSVDWHRTTEDTTVSHQAATEDGKTSAETFLVPDQENNASNESILQKPQLIYEPSFPEFSKGATYNLVCSFGTVASPAALAFVFQKDGVEIQTSSRDRLTLEVADPAKHNGKYVCCVLLGSLKSEYSDELNVTIRAGGRYCEIPDMPCPKSEGFTRRCDVKTNRCECKANFITSGLECKSLATVMAGSPTFMSISLTTLAVYRGLLTMFS